MYKESWSRKTPAKERVSKIDTQPEFLPAPERTKEVSVHTFTTQEYPRIIVEGKIREIKGKYTSADGYSFELIGGGLVNSNDTVEVPE